MKVLSPVPSSGPLPQSLAFCSLNFCISCLSTDSSSSHPFPLGSAPVPRTYASPFPCSARRQNCFQSTVELSRRSPFHKAVPDPEDMPLPTNCFHVFLPQAMIGPLPNRFMSPLPYFPPPSETRTREGVKLPPLRLPQKELRECAFFLFFLAGLGSFAPRNNKVFSHAAGAYRRAFAMPLFNIAIKFTPSQSPLEVPCDDKNASVRPGSHQSCQSVCSAFASPEFLPALLGAVGGRQVPFFSRVDWQVFFRRFF